MPTWSAQECRSLSPWDWQTFSYHDYEPHACMKLQNELLLWVSNLGGGWAAGGSDQTKFVSSINMRWKIVFSWRSLSKRPVEFSNILDKCHRKMPLELYPCEISALTYKFLQSCRHSRDIPSDRCKYISQDPCRTQWRKRVSRLCRLRFLVTVLALGIVQPWRQTAQGKFPLSWRMSYSKP